MSDPQNNSCVSFTMDHFDLADADYVGCQQVGTPDITNSLSPQSQIRFELSALIIILLNLHYISGWLGS